jgi:hypothetical protein
VCQLLEALAAPGKDALQLTSPINRAPPWVRSRHKLLDGGIEFRQPNTALVALEEGLVGTFCAGDDPDLAFIDLPLFHHQLATMASEVALT